MFLIIYDVKYFKVFKYSLDMMPFFVGSQVKRQMLLDLNVIAAPACWGRFHACSSPPDATQCYIDEMTIYMLLAQLKSYFV